MIDMIVVILIFFGVFFMATGVVGLVRMSDVFSRMHATSTATTMGTACLISAGILEFRVEIQSLTLILVVAFLFVTAPTGNHLLARAVAEK